MNVFTLSGHEVKAADLVDGVFIDPELPADFDATANDDRPQEQRIWWNVPFIRTTRSEEPAFVKEFPGGVRFEVRCLDGGAWDRSTWWGAFATRGEAIACAKAGPQYRLRKPPPSESASD